MIPPEPQIRALMERQGFGRIEAIRNLQQRAILSRRPKGMTPK